LKTLAKRPAKSPARRRPAAVVEESASFDGVWLTRAALGIATAIVIARVCMSETIRVVGFVSPGSPEAPAGPGPACGLVFDLIALLCPMLVLARRWIDPSFTLRRSISPIIYLLLAIWAVASTLWASDKFSAIVSAMHLVAAAGVLWAVSQSVAGWRDLWLVAAFCGGLLAVLLTHGLWYHLMDRPELLRVFHDDPTIVQKMQNVQPGTFEYNQIVNSIEHGELRGFSVSPNTYGAQLVLLGLVTLSIFVACLRLRHMTGAIVSGLLIVVDLVCLPLTQSRSAFLTGFLGAALLAIFVCFNWPRQSRQGPSPLAELMRRKATLLYMAGVAAVLAVIAFIVGYGTSHGTLFQDSLNFRWRYWTASAQLFRQHLFLGVGWENFGNPYLGVRIPEATEEIKDPHDFLVRYATELGVIGLILALAWTARTWWELSRPAGLVKEAEESPNGKPLDLRKTFLLLSPLVGGIVLGAICAIDWNSPAGFVLLELLRRGAFLIVLIVAAPLLAWRFQAAEFGTSEMRQRTEAAPEVLLGLLIALGMFFIHSLVDFPMFEVGPMFLLASLLGAAIGFRSPASEGKGDSAKPRRRARLALAICGAGWLVIAVVLAVPVISAEADAKDGDDLLRNSAVDNRIIPDRVAAAADRYEAAFRGTVPNSSYATRAALAWNLISQSEKAKTWFDAAIAADPGNPANYSRRAEFFAQSQPPDYGSAVRDMTKSIQLDPMNRLDRLRLATFLENAGQPDEAMAQIFTALELNDRLTLVERRRLTADQFRDVPPALARLTVKRLMRGN
jgi:hypothetical protein